MNRATTHATTHVNASYLASLAPAMHNGGLDAIMGAVQDDFVPETAPADTDWTAPAAAAPATKLSNPAFAGQGKFRGKVMPTEEQRRSSAAAERKKQAEKTKGKSASKSASKSKSKNKDDEDDGWFVGGFESDHDQTEEEEDEAGEDEEPEEDDDEANTDDREFLATDDDVSAATTVDEDGEADVPSQPKIAAKKRKRSAFVDDEAIDCSDEEEEEEIRKPKKAKKQMNAVEEVAVVRKPAKKAPQTDAEDAAPMDTDAVTTPWVNIVAASLALQTHWKALELGKPISIFMTANGPVFTSFKGILVSKRGYVHKGLTPNMATPAINSISTAFVSYTRVPGSPPEMHLVSGVLCVSPDDDDVIVLGVPLEQQRIAFLAHKPVAWQQKRKESLQPVLPPMPGNVTVERVSSLLMSGKGSKFISTQPGVQAQEMRQAYMNGVAKLFLTYCTAANIDPTPWLTEQPQAKPAVKAKALKKSTPSVLELITHPAPALPAAPALAVAAPALAPAVAAELDFDVTTLVQHFAAKGVRCTVSFTMM